MYEGVEIRISLKRNNFRSKFDYIVSSKVNLKI